MRRGIGVMAQRAPVPLGEILEARNRVEALEPLRTHTVDVLIQKEYGSALNLESVASSLYVNPSYLSQLFHWETGQKFIAYLTELRIEKAKELMARPQAENLRDRRDGRLPEQALLQQAVREIHRHDPQGVPQLHLAARHRLTGPAVHAGGPPAAAGMPPLLIIEGVFLRAAWMKGQDHPCGIDGQFLFALPGILAYN